MPILRGIAPLPPCRQSCVLLTTLGGRSNSYRPIQSEECRGNGPDGGILTSPQRSRRQYTSLPSRTWPWRSRSVLERRTTRHRIRQPGGPPCPRDGAGAGLEISSRRGQGAKKAKDDLRSRGHCRDRQEANQVAPKRQGFSGLAWGPVDGGDSDKCVLCIAYKAPQNGRPDPF